MKEIHEVSNFSANLPGHYPIRIFSPLLLTMINASSPFLFSFPFTLMWRLFLVLQTLPTLNHNCLISNFVINVTEQPNNMKARLSPAVPHRSPFTTITVFSLTERNPIISSFSIISFPPFLGSRTQLWRIFKDKRSQANYDYFSVTLPINMRRYCNVHVHNIYAETRWLQC